MKNNKFLVGILGCGNIARHHVEGVLQNEEIMDLYAVCDIDVEKAKEFAAKYKVDKVFSSYNEMLELEELDIICICTPSGVHAEQAIKAAEYGKHILCEKPLDISKEALDNLEDAFKDNNSKFCTVFQYRTLSGNIEAREILDKGELGKILIGNGHAKLYRSQAYYDSAGWRGTWAYDGGGCLMNQAIHTLDILAWFCGGVKSTKSKTYTLARNIEVEDTSFSFLNFKNGSKGSFFATTVSNPNQGVKVEIFCEKGTIIFDGEKTYILKEKNPKDDNNGENKIILGDKDSKVSYGHGILLKNLAESIKNDTETLIPIKEGRHSVDTILAIYKSSKTDEEVFI